jgi:hypothetical protein
MEDPMRRVADTVAILLLALATAACAATPSLTPASTPVSTAGAPTSSPSASSLDAARADLDHTLAQLEATHPEPFHAIDRATFTSALEELKARLPELTPEEAVVRLMATWAMLSRERDGHQFALPTDDAMDPILPIRVYEFADGVFVTAAMPRNQDLVGARIVAVGVEPIDDVLSLLEPLVPRDGPATVPAFRPVYLLHAIVLRGLGLAGDGPVALTVAGSDGATRQVELDPVPAADFVAWAGWLPYTGLPPREGLRHTLPVESNLSVARLSDSVVYARYRQVQRIDARDLQQLQELASDPAVTRVIVDVRQNPGGNNNIYPPLVSLLTQIDSERPGRLVLLTDRITFSAASNFSTVVEQGTGATFVGEPMGGGLNFWDDVRWVTLADYPIPMRVAMSTRYWQKSTADDDRLTIEPDVSVPVLSADYFEGRDPALAAAMGANAP